jgi:hypothetical protein
MCLALLPESNGYEKARETLRNRDLCIPWKIVKAKAFTIFVSSYT